MAVGLLREPVDELGLGVADTVDVKEVSTAEGEGVFSIFSNATPQNQTHVRRPQSGRGRTGHRTEGNPRWSLCIVVAIRLDRFPSRPE